MNWLTRFSLKNTAAVLIIALLIAFVGSYSAVKLKKETMPDISIPIIAVITPYPGAAPSDVKDLVSEPLSKSITGIPGLKDVSTTSTDNISTIIAQFDFSADLDEAKRKIDEAISKVSLPEGVVDPQVTRISFGSFPILKVSLSNKNISDAKLEKQIRANIVPNLTTVAGVGQVNVSTQKDSGVYVRLLPDKLKKYGLTFQQIQQQMQGNNMSFPITSLTIGDQSKPVRLSGQITSVDDVKNMLIPVFPDTQKSMSNTFSQMGKGVADLGEAVGQLGQGLTGMNQALSAQIQLVSAINQTQSQLMDAKLAIQQQNLVLMNPAAKPEEKAKAQKMMAQLTKQIQIGQTALNSMQKQLKSIQTAMSSGAKPSQGIQPKQPVKQTNQTSADQSIKVVKLKDLAEIKSGSADVTAISRTNGATSVVLDIIKTQDSNTVDVAEDVKSQFTKLKSELPKGTDVTVVFDQSTAVKQSINGMMKEGILGAIFACIVILLFLRNVRSTLISIISIPLSILIAMLFLKQFNITLNVMTLGGLAVAVGRVVDDSIVVIENTYRHLMNTKDRDTNIILVGVKEVASAITSSTLTTMAVFLPLGLVSGMIGKIFLPFALTVVFSLLASLIVAVTIVPLLAKLFLLKQKNIKQHEETKGNGVLFYQRVLSWSLRHKGIVSLLSILLLVGSVALVPLIGTGFIPESKEKYVNVDVTYPVGTTLKITDAIVKKVETLLAKEKSVDFYQTTIGSAKGSLNTSGKISGTNTGNIFVQLKDTANVEAVVKKLQNEVTPLMDHKADIKVSQMNPNGGGSNNNVEVTVSGSNLADVKKATDTLTKQFNGIKNVDDISNNLSEAKPQINIKVNQDEAAKEGLTTAQIMSSVKELLTDQKVTSFKAGKDQVDINLGLKLKAPTKLKDISSLDFKTPTGKTISLSDVADVKEVQGPVSIQEKNGEQYATITLSSKTNDIGSITKQVTMKLKSAKLPSSVDASIGGATQQMNEGFSQLGIALLVAIGAVYLVMVIAFGEAKAPFAILFALPLAIIGGLIGLFITGKVLDMPAMIGALMLVGIAVTNAIVLVDRVQQQRKHGLSIRESLIEAGSTRLRPILMTAIATICALLPMSFGLSEGALLSQSLAIVVIGGLTTSTLLTLIVVPVVYEMIYRKERKKEKMLKEAA
ncbi:efflux RND transporter permease subunit [Neobacillus niacini]|uniref:efflux RND transporter permease subunit n=1 Tax=Neobacillus niacini TaxID=86668 RepID=UPI00285FD5C6|nr:efflux RND transporter permease subunit [Neobacillus niacini]MDR7001097.1 HAE1 family hydrophobic/amphiphilic exporter-1 [Neobacillus niacini]